MSEIKIELTRKSIDEAIRYLEDYQTYIKNALHEVIKRLVEVGMTNLEMRIAIAQYDGVNDATAEIEETENGFNLCMKGKSVAFIEFGTGVHYNPDGVRNYDGQIPQGIVDIGMYGQGRGALDYWFYKIDDGVVGFTHGNLPNACLYEAGQEMKRQVLTIAKGVFSGNDRY